jgi:hypothetical protein
MRQFKYCIWLKLDEDHSLNKKCDFPLHITIKSDLEKNEAIEFYQKINKSVLPIKIEIKERKDGYHNNFYAYYFLTDTNNKSNLWWWRDNMHLSVKYKYGTNNDTFDNIKISSDYLKELIGTKLIFNEICIYHCDNHYNNWYQVNF